jgi:hypothetical protein
MFNKKSKTILFFILLISIVFLLFVFQQHLVSNAVKAEFLNSGVTEANYNQYKVVKCSFNPFKPEFYLVNDLFYEMSSKYNIFMYEIKSPLSLSPEAMRSGSASVANTDFNSLVKMIQNDCSQFKSGEGGSSDIGVNWSYEKSKSKEDIDASKIDALLTQYEYYSDETKAIFKEIYGNIEVMSNDELLSLANSIYVNGLNDKVEQQIILEEKEYQSKIESGEIKVLTTEEKMRNAGFPEEDIRIAVQSIGEKYVGPTN